MNILDAVIVIVSLIHFILVILMEDNRFVRTFRILRLARIWKLGHYFKSMRRMLATTWRSVKDIVSFSALLFLYSFVFALIGKELFAYKAILHEDDDSLVYTEERIMEYLSDESRIVRYPRENFNSFAEALTTIFIVIMGEDWNFVMYTWLRAVSDDPMRV